MSNDVIKARSVNFPASPAQTVGPAPTDPQYDTGRHCALIPLQHVVIIDSCGLHPGPRFAAEKHSRQKNPDR